MTGVALFASFLAVLHYVQAPPEVAGYGFGASVLEASVVYLLPGAVAGILAAPYAGRMVSRLGALPTLLRRAPRPGSPASPCWPCCAARPGSSSSRGCSPSWRSRSPTPRCPRWSCTRCGRRRPGWPTRSTRSPGPSGRPLGSTLAVTFIAANLDPATGFPRDVAFTLVALTGAIASVAVMVVAAAGLWADRAGRRRGAAGRGRGGDARPAASGRRCPGSAEPRRAGRGEWNGIVRGTRVEGSPSPDFPRRITHDPTHRLLQLDRGDARPRPAVTPRPRPTRSAGRAPTTPRPAPTRSPPPAARSSGR